MLDLTDWQNKKYTTRDGRPVRILCVDAVGEWPIIGTLFNEKEPGGPREYPMVWDADGKREHGYEDILDLINAKTKREGWVNLSRDPEYPAYAGVVYPTEQLAKAYESTDRIATIRIEWEE